ncbi:hypothetical protein ACJIZ3_018363 [Penstemon smallii]|uniref:Nitroreductase domain-containing protein n=1 Tax=Penstemon smallii TaxID=265156 RepID=A0ABD3SYT0_9LAMI
MPIKMLLFNHHNHHLPFPLPFTTTTTAAAGKLVRPFLIMSKSYSQETPTVEEDKPQLLINQVLKYHNQTKHSFTNYARGPHGLDWANQPNPFRRYLSAPLLPLLHHPEQNDPLYSSLFHSLPSPKPLSKTTISQFFYNSLALSAWKSTGFSTWSLRVNPSSGNLHPTEAYIISPPVESLSEHPFVAHYAPKEHALELRAQIPSGFLEYFPKGSFLIGFSSIFWREAWKYGERGFRYCNHDVGHAIGAVSIAAGGLGWDVKVLDGLGCEELEKLMGLVGTFPKFSIPSRPVRGRMPEIEFEHPDCVLLVFPKGVGEFEVDWQKLSVALSEFSNLEWNGKPNLLSKEHLCWDVIFKTAEAARKPLTRVTEVVSEPFGCIGIISESSYKGFSVSELVRRRRSAVDMDGSTMMEMESFYQILLHCMPSGSGESGEGKQKRQLAFPFRALPWHSQVHAVLFVHRVVGLPSGLYFLVRNEDHLDELTKVTRPEFRWVKPNGCPNDLPLYELSQGDCRELSKRLSCHQDIASDGCFSLGMVARVEPTLQESGAWMYPRLFWETGVLGQVLYLEAHAVGVSATGIGCFFDDPGMS